MKLAKICGVRTVEAAERAIDCHADLVGMIMVPNRKRTVDKKVATQISNTVRRRRAEHKRKIQNAHELIKEIESSSHDSVEALLMKIHLLLQENGPFCVGVFRNQGIDEVFSTARELNLDFIQLHGSEDKVKFAEFNARDKKFVIIPRYVVPNDTSKLEAVLHSMLNNGEYVGNGMGIPLLDSEAGGEGIKIDWDAVARISCGKFILAGGLTSTNLKDTGHMDNVIGYDVSGGVEDADGNKDLEEIERFVTAAHGV